jgi:hypothetical protein
VAPAVLAQQAQRRVVGDPVEPRPQLQLRLARPDRAVRVHEGLLDRVLRALGREQPAAVAEQRPAVAGDDRLEGAVVAGPREIDQPLVALGVEEGRTREAGGFDESARGHGTTVP